MGDFLSIAGTVLAAGIGGIVAKAFVTQLDRIASAFERMETEARERGNAAVSQLGRTADAVHDMANRLQTMSRVSEIQLERMDRARPAIDPGAGEIGREAVIPRADPLGTHSRDVICPACVGKFPADHTCKLCFGSNVTSEQAAAAYRAARGLAGEF